MAEKHSKLTQAAKVLGAAGGAVGGPARARALGAAARKAIARQGGMAKARKGRKKKD